MKIAIDARVIERRISGIGRYLEGFLNWLIDIDKKNQYFLLSYDPLIKFEKKGFKVISTGKNSFLPDKFYNFYWLEFLVPKILKENKIDVFFNPNHYLPIKNISCGKVITIHDFAHKASKAYKSFIYRVFYLNYLLPVSAKKADLVFTISSSSKEDIVKYCKIKKEKIKTIYPAADERFKPRQIREEEASAIKNKYNLPEKFVLYVGRIENRKNIKCVLKVADKMKEIKEFSSLRFVLVGEVGYAGSGGLLYEIRKRDNVFHIDHVAEKDLPYFYNLAKVFLYPSFYEGFGLGVLEAMQSGLPVLASDKSSLPEVVGKGGIMHSPDKYDLFAKDLIRLLNDNNFYREMSQKAIFQSKNFSWEKSAKKMVEVFNNFKGLYE